MRNRVAAALGAVLLAGGVVAAGATGGIAVAEPLPRETGPMFPVHPDDIDGGQGGVDGGQGGVDGRVEDEPAPAPTGEVGEETGAPEGDGGEDAYLVESYFTTWNTEASFVKTETGVELHVTEKVVAETPDGHPAEGFRHDLLMAASEDPASDIDRLTEVSATDAEGNELEVRAIAGEVVEEGASPVTLQVVDPDPDENINSYTLKYTVIDPFVASGEAGDTAIVTFGPVGSHRLIKSYSAVVTMDEHVTAQSQDPVCLMVQDEQKLDCTMTGEGGRLMLTSASGELTSGEYFMVAFVGDDLAQLPGDEGEQSESEGDQPEAASAERPFPEFTTWAAAAGLGALTIGTAAVLLTSRRKHDAVTPDNYS